MSWVYKREQDRFESWAYGQELERLSSIAKQFQQSAKMGDLYTYKFTTFTEESRLLKKSLELDERWKDENLFAVDPFAALVYLGEIERDKTDTDRWYKFLGINIHGDSCVGWLDEWNLEYIVEYKR